MNGAHDDHDAMKDLVAVLALGALGESEHRIATLHLASCPECRLEFEELRPVADAVGLAAEHDMPEHRRLQMRAQLMETVTPRLARSTRRSLLAWLPALAAAAILVFAIVTMQHDAGLRSRIEAQQAIIADLSAPDAQRYPVRGGEVIRRGDHLYLALRSLPALPQGKVYEAWTQAKGATTMTPSVLFRPPATTRPELIVLPVDASRIVAVAVSVEPEGGSKAPTTTPAFVRPLT